MVASLGAILIVCCLIPLNGSAGIRSERPSQIQFIARNLGSGASLAYNLGDHILFGANYFATSAEHEGEDTDNNETVNFEFATSELFLRYYLMEDSGFYISGASVFRHWKITVTGTDEIGDSGEVAEYKLTAEWPTTAFSYGLGYQWIMDFGLSLGAYMGMISGGEPELKGEVDDDSISQSDVDKEVDEIEEEENFGEKYANVFIAGFSLGFNF